MKKVIGEQAGLYSALFLREGSWTDSIRITWALPQNFWVRFFFSLMDPQEALLVDRRARYLGQAAWIKISVPLLICCMILGLNLTPIRIYCELGLPIMLDC